MVRAHKEGNASLQLSGPLSSTGTSRLGELANTPEFAKAQRQRKKVQALFAELKNQIGLRRSLPAEIEVCQEQFFPFLLAAAAQNIKRLLRFLSQPTTPILPATA